MFIMRGWHSPGISEISREMAQQVDVPYMVKSNVGVRRYV